MKQQRSSREKAKAVAASQQQAPQQQTPDNGRSEAENKKLAALGQVPETPVLDELQNQGPAPEAQQAAPAQDAPAQEAPDNGRTLAENAKLAAIETMSGPAPAVANDEEQAEEESTEAGAQEVGNGGQANAAPPAGDGDGAEDAEPEANIDIQAVENNAGGPEAPAEPGGDDAGGDAAAAGDGGGGGGAGGAGGGGGGGGGGGAGGGDAPDVEIAPLEFTANNTNAAFEQFQTATPTQMANSWGALGGVMNEGLSAESTEFNESVPNFEAKMSGEQPSDAQTQVQSVDADTGVIDDSPGQAPAPEIAETEHGQQPDRRVDRGIFGGWASGEDADTSSNARAINQGIGSVSTSGGDVQTSPGPRPNIPTEGQSDPQRIGDKAAAANLEINDGASAAQQAVLASPGAEQVQPLEMTENFEVPGLAEPTGISEQIPNGDMEAYVALNLPGGVQAAFDELGADQFQGNLAQGTSELQAAADTRDTDRTAEIDRANQETQRLTTEANASQMAEVQNQRSLIEQERQSTIDQQTAAVANVNADLDAQRQDQLSQIDGRIAADQARINNEYANAQRDASAEVAAGERKAAEEKRKSEREAENKSWWDRACDFVSDCISALADLVSDIFNAVREAVTAILDAVKELANTIIDAAVAFINEAIAAFGELVKAAIQDLLGSVFPELADALCDFVDSAVTYAQEAVTALGEQLKEGIAALCDAVGAVLNTILSIYEAAINTALAFASAVITGDWKQFLLQALEAALTIAGISKDEFYAFVGRTEETIDIIVNDPGGFLGNCIDALSQGFGQFSDNFLDHLQVGFIDWMTGQAGDAGITLPEELNLAGVFDICLQVLGLTPDALREKATEHLGEENVERIEFVWGFIESTIEGGLDGLWEHVQEYMGSLWDMVIGGIQDWLMEKIVVAAVTKIASMFSPVGAIVQALITAWNMYCFVRDQIQRIYGVVTAIVNGIGDIARGQIGGAANMVEDQLGNLVPVAIDLLARLLGIGGIGAKVREVIEGVQTMVSDAIDSMIEKVKGMFTGGGSDQDSSDSESGTEQDVDQDVDPTGTAAEEQEDTTSPRLSNSWSTMGSTLYRGSDDMVANISANGSYRLSIVNRQALEQNFQRGEEWDNAGLSSWVGGKVSNATKAAMGQSNLPVLDLISAGSYSGIAGVAKATATAELASLGLAVDELTISRISGGEELEAAIDQAAAQNILSDGEVGERIQFNADGEGHTLWVNVRGNRAEVMVASTPMTVGERISGWTTRCAELDAEKIGEARGLLSQAASKLGIADALADRLAAITQDASGQDVDADRVQQQDEDLENEEENLSSVLARLFVLFEDDGEDDYTAPVYNYLGQQIAVRVEDGDDRLTVTTIEGYQIFVRAGSATIRRDGRTEDLPLVHIDSDGKLREGSARDTVLPGAQEEPANLLQERQQFEARLGQYAARHPVAVGTGRAMAAKAGDYMKEAAEVAEFNTELATAKERLDAMYAAAGSDATGTWAGRVSVDPEDLAAVFQGGGTLRESMTHVQNFGANVLGSHVVKPEFRAKALEIAEKADLNATAIRERQQAAQEFRDSGRNTDRHGEQNDVDGWNDFYGLNEDPILEQQGQMRTRAPRGTDTSSTVTRGQFFADGGLTSEREDEHESALGAEFMPWGEGSKVWLVNVESEIVQDLGGSVPLLAGISGTTARLMQMGINLGMSSQNDVRLACLGYLMPIRAHSFHEVMASAASFGTSYGGDCDYTAIAPLTPAGTRQACGPFPGEGEPSA